MDLELGGHLRLVQEILAGGSSCHFVVNLSSTIPLPLYHRWAGGVLLGVVRNLQQKHQARPVVGRFTGD